MKSEERDGLVREHGSIGKVSLTFVKEKPNEERYIQFLESCIKRPPNAATPTITIRCKHPPYRRKRHGRQPVAAKRDYEVSVDGKNMGKVLKS